MAEKVYAGDIKAKNLLDEADEDGELKQTIVIQCDSREELKEALQTGFIMFAL